jgi:hypothetical protein
MQSNKLKSEASKRKNTIAKFKKVKKIIKLMLLNLGSHPGKKPTDLKLLAAWQENLLKSSADKQSKICIYVHFHDSVPAEKFNVTNMLMNSSVCKQMQHDLKLPANTPVEELQFFNI